MQLFVKSQDTHVFDVSGNETVADVKALVASKESMPTGDLALYCEGRPLADDESLSGFGELASLCVELKLRGGKVHGSLARAGKVKGQTPKVYTYIYYRYIVHVYILHKYNSESTKYLCYTYYCRSLYLSGRVCYGIYNYKAIIIKH